MVGVGDHHPEDSKGKELGSRQQRWLALEKQNADAVIELTEEQAKFLEKLKTFFPPYDAGVVGPRS